MRPVAARAPSVCLGHVAAAHGLKGEVRLVSYTAEPADIARYGPLEDERGLRRFTVLSLRQGRGGLIARMEGVSDRAAAESLKGVRLYVPRDRLPAPEAEEWYHADLVGLVAVSPDGAALGQVVAVHNFGAGDLLELRPAEGGATVLVPFTHEVVPEIDIDSGWLLLDPPPGLFE